MNIQSIVLSSLLFMVPLSLIILYDLSIRIHNKKTKSLFDDNPVKRIVSLSDLEDFLDWEFKHLSVKSSYRLETVRELDSFMDSHNDISIPLYVNFTIYVDTTLTNNYLSSLQHRILMRFPVCTPVSVIVLRDPK